MAYEQKNGQITVWKNEKFVQGGTQPYAKGTGKDLQGNDIDVALWIPKSERVKGFNLTITTPYKGSDAPQNTHTSEPANVVASAGDDSLPF